MDIRTRLEHLNLIPVSEELLNDEIISEISKENPIVLVCDVSERTDSNGRLEYIKALAEAGIIGEEEIRPVMEDNSLVIIVPFHTMEIADQVYRRIKHATHFVAMYVDGRVQPGC